MKIFALISPVGRAFMATTTPFRSFQPTPYIYKYFN